MTEGQMVVLLREACGNGKHGEGSPFRVARLLGLLTKDGQIAAKETTPNSDRSKWSAERYKFLLDADFLVSNQCCNVMKKSPAHSYARKTGRHPITAQMASESRIRAQKWMQHGCNAFDAQNPISNPMSFWTEQDVLLYIVQNQLPICSVYGDIVEDTDIDIPEGQMNIEDYIGKDHLELFDLGSPTFKTTGCQRTGCVFCLYGAHLEKEYPNRLERLKMTHPKLYEYIMKPWSDGGLDYKRVIDWTNEHGNLHIRY